MNTRVSSIAELKANGWGDRAEAFRKFLIACDDACWKAIGLSIYDLPDQDYASAFEDEVDPEEFVDDVISEEMSGMGL